MNPLYSLFFLLNLSLAVTAAPQNKDQPILNRYIIKLKPSVTVSSFDRQLKRVIAKHSNTESDDKQRIVHRYENAFHGYAAVLNANMKAELAANPSIAYIEQDYRGSFDATSPTVKQATPPSWGLTRVSEKTLDLNAPYEYPASAGQGATAYVIDSGIDTNHTDFEGRASFGINYVKDEPDADLQGHGSHVAGTIGGKTYGISKKVNLVAVKACGEASCEASDVVAGINWVIEHGVPLKSVINMSLNFPGSQAMDDAVNAAVAKGIAVVVSAGNTGANSCERSPRRAKDAFPVGAIDNTDTMADFSSYGPCLRVFAPGVDIISVKPNGGDRSMSGTSMASPHVTGIAALYLAENSYASVKDLYTDLTTRAQAGLVKGVPENSETTDILVYSLPKDQSA